MSCGFFFLHFDKNIFRKKNSTLYLFFKRHILFFFDQLYLQVFSLSRPFSTFMSNDHTIISVHYSRQRLINPFHRWFSDSDSIEKAYPGLHWINVTVIQNVRPTRIRLKTRMDIIALHFDTEQTPGGQGSICNRTNFVIFNLY